MFQIKVEFRVHRFGVFCDAFIFDNKGDAAVFLQYEEKKKINVDNGTYDASEKLYSKLKELFPRSYSDNGVYRSITRELNYDFEKHQFIQDKNNVQKIYKYTFDFRTEEAFVSDAVQKLQEAGFKVLSSG